MKYQLRNWIKKLGENLCGTNSRRTRRLRTTSSRPRLEVLEDRVVPSTYAVTNTNYAGVGSLGAAITAAEAANDAQAVIVFNGIAANSTIQLTATDVSSNANFGPTAFVVSGTDVNITIYGGSAPGLTIDGGNAVRLFAVSAGDSLTVSNLTLADGLAQGGAGGNGNSGGGGGAGLGGAAFVQAGGTLTVQSSTITGNVALGGTGGSGTDTGYIGGGGGGGIGSAGGDNQARYGGTGGGPNGAPRGPAYNYPIVGGYGGGGSGGGAAWGGALGGFGGGGGGEGSANGWSCYGGGGFGGGGGGCNSSNANSSGGQAGVGGFGGGAGAGIGTGANGYGGGGGGGMGGAIFANGNVIITNSTLTGNSAIGGTAGPNATNGEGLGGAVFVRNGSLTLVSSTISGNTAAQGGRGVYIIGDGATVAGSLTNAIIGQADTSVTDFVATSINGGSTTTSGTANIIGSAVGFTGSFSAVNPMLGALANNGGPTKTMALQAGSPAIGAGGADHHSRIWLHHLRHFDFRHATNGITPNSIISIDGEVMLVTAINGSTLSVVRGYNNTTHVTGNSFDPIYLHLDQAGNAIGSASPDIGALQTAGTAPLAPTVTTVSPSSGTLYGGTTVTITGTHLQNATSVNFGPYLGTIISDTGTTIVAKTQRSNPGTFDTTVTTVGWDTSAINSPADQYTFTGNLPTYNEYLDSSGNLTITMDTPAVNANLSFALTGGNYTFSDSGGNLFDVLVGPGAGSTTLTGFGTSSISIPASAVNSITVNLGTGTNVFTITTSTGSVAPLTVNTGSTAGDVINMTGAMTDSGAVSLTSNSLTSSVGANLSAVSVTLAGAGTSTLHGNIQIGGTLTLNDTGATTISGNIDLGATGNLVDTSTGNDTITGLIFGEASSGNLLRPGY